MSKVLHANAQFQALVTCSWENAAGFPHPPAAVLAAVVARPSETETENALRAAGNRTAGLAPARNDDVITTASKLHSQALHPPNKLRRSTMPALGRKSGRVAKVGI